MGRFGTRGEGVEGGEYLGVAVGDVLLEGVEEGERLFELEEVVVTRPR